MPKRWPKKKDTKVSIDKCGTVQIVYFSGTGGTYRVASGFQKKLTEKGYKVSMVPLDQQAEGYQQNPRVEDSVGLLLLIYSVHAFGAPIPVDEWIAELPAISIKIPAAVISVSGGGEIWPNTACRIQSIKGLESKDFTVFYERMLVMPSNILIGTKEELAIQLLRCLPLKIEHSIDEIFSGRIRRKRKPVTAELSMAVNKSEKKYAAIYGKELKVKDYCTGCGWCKDHCPRLNITMTEERPEFGNKCILCLRCTYGCPVNAIYAKNDSFIKIKDYNLNQLDKRANEYESGKELFAKKVKAGILFTGVKKYINKIEF